LQNPPPDVPAQEPPVPPVPIPPATPPAVDRVAAPLPEEERFEHESADGGEYHAARIALPSPDEERFSYDDALGHTVPFTPVDVIDEPETSAGPSEVAFNAELAAAVLAARGEAGAMAAAEPAYAEPTAATLLADPILEPTAHLTDERQPTYEFDSLPAEAFDLYPDAAPHRRRSPLAILALLLLIVVVLAALAVTALAVSDVLSR
jgi:hypothetical protein